MRLLILAAGGHSRRHWCCHGSRVSPPPPRHAPPLPQRQRSDCRGFRPRRYPQCSRRVHAEPARLGIQRSRRSRCLRQRKAKLIPTRQKKTGAVPRFSSFTRDSVGNVWRFTASDRRPGAATVRHVPARRMGGAKRYPSIASYGDDGFRRLNPSYVLLPIAA